MIHLTCNKLKEIKKEYNIKFSFNYMRAQIVKPSIQKQLNIEIEDCGKSVKMYINKNDLQKLVDYFLNRNKKRAIHPNTKKFLYLKGETSK